MIEPKITREIICVSEMARLLGLSRSRFYELIKHGIFPPPASCESIKRPFYDRAAQERCLEIRRTGQGFDGRPILFYSSRRREDKSLIPRKPSRARRPVSAAPTDSPDPMIEQLQRGLQQLGVEIEDASLKVALTTSFPLGVDGLSPEQVLITVFRNVKQLTR